MPARHRAAAPWDPAQYARYADERARPFHDLLARVDAEAPRLVVDLGCGPGDLTAVLAARWPSARVLGVDSSPTMLARAADHAQPGRLDFVAGDIASWRPEAPVDVLFSNAALQWVDGHLDLLPELVSTVASGGWFAFQVPGNFGAPSHTLLADLRQSARWRTQLGDDAVRLGSHDPGVYVDRLARLGATVDAWETTYLHLLPGDDPVLEWTKGTALRPVLARLDDTGAADFLADYGALLRQAYPRSDYGTVLEFRRVFVVASFP